MRYNKVFSYTHLHRREKDGVRASASAHGIQPAGRRVPDQASGKARQRMKYTFEDYGNASVAVFKGIGMLFTGGLRNMSGIVGIFTTSAQLYGNYQFATYLYFWGLISVNLAIFNLLPFPGLDGWQILVTTVEGITRKKIPNKVKSIVSFVGLALLFLLMIAVISFDVLRIVGVM